MSNLHSVGTGTVSQLRTGFTQEGEKWIAFRLSVWIKSRTAEDGSVEQVWRHLSAYTDGEKRAERWWKLLGRRLKPTVMVKGLTELRVRSVENRLEVEETFYRPMMSMVHWGEETERPPWDPWGPQGRQGEPEPQKEEIEKGAVGGAGETMQVPPDAGAQDHQDGEEEGENEVPEF